MIRSAAMIEALAVDHDVSVVLCSNKPFDPELLAAATSFCHGQGIDLTVWRVGGLAYDHRWWRRIRAGTAALHRSTDRLIRRPLPEPIATMVRSTDLLWVVRPEIFADHLVPDHPAMVLDVDDLVEDIHVTPGLSERLWIRRHLRMLSAVASRASVALVCSDRDREAANLPCHVRVLSNTAPDRHSTTAPEPHSESHPDQPVVQPVVSLVGVMDYGPNREGATWLIETVWPLVTAARPDAQLRVVGRGSEALNRYRKIPGVDIVGSVPDIARYVSEAMVSVAPIHRGSGTRVKVLEAFAAGVPVVATTVGAYGLDVIAATDLHITDDPGQFADDIVALLNDASGRQAMGRAGRAVYDQSYSADVFNQQVRSIASDVLAGASLPKH
jgi:glycosyltransferase involved in cell wall biosynthesis